MDPFNAFLVGSGEHLLNKDAPDGQFLDLNRCHVSGCYDHVRIGSSSRSLTAVRSQGTGSVAALCHVLAPDEFVKALAHYDHEQHEDMVRWSGKSFDAEYACTSTGSLSILIGSRKNGPHAPARKLEATTGAARSRGLRWMVTTHSIVSLPKTRARYIRGYPHMM